ADGVLAIVGKGAAGSDAGTGAGDGGGDGAAAVERAGQLGDAGASRAAGRAVFAADARATLRSPCLRWTQGEAGARIGRQQQTMASTLARLRGVPRDTLLFLAYVLAANIALGTFTLVFNLYLLELSFKEDFIGLAASLQTGAMAVTAVTQGRLLGRWGVWRVVLISLIIYAGLSAALSLATAGYLILLLSLLWGGASSFVIAAV